MELRLFNTFSGKKEKFLPLQKGEVSLYTCGPTVYHYAHIGNHRGNLFYDTLKRVLLFNDYKVKHVMNITDVGHLTSDADDGEDKMLKGAKREKKTVWEIAEFYTDAFKRDIKKLNLLQPNYFPRATDHITEQLEMINVLEKKGFTYQAGGNVYFDTSKFKEYGKLAGLDIEGEGKTRVEKARVEKDKNKKNPQDFVLWFTKSKFSDQEMKWKSSYGEGYPGWHLECSAMAMKYLGKEMDIHCGGIDHIPVHHTNEIAQSEAYTGKKWVRYWMHNEFLVLDHTRENGEKGEKMAKSGDNFLTVSTLEEKGYDALDYRYLCLGSHYRKQLVFSWEGMESARNSRKKLIDKVLEIKATHKVDNEKIQKKYLERFTAEINDDLNTPQGLATLWEVLKDENLADHDKYFLVLEFDKVLGLGLGSLKEEKVPSAVKK
ncbi:cysteine--tRNA ligase, partial [Candidatus Woesearchaeota archaeon]|nr:cysteine--tRNA ligase [Candidatus Woesearchaeota archaeon]